MTQHFAPSGEFAGWQYWPNDPFEQTAGPFYFTQKDGAPVCAFRPSVRTPPGPR